MVILNTRFLFLAIAPFHLLMLPLQAFLYGVQLLAGVDPELMILIGAIANTPVIYQGMRLARTKRTITRRTYWFGYKCSLFLALHVAITVLLFGLTLQILISTTSDTSLRRLIHPFSYALEGYLWACIIGSLVTAAFLKPYKTKASDIYQ